MIIGLDESKRVIDVGDVGVVQNDCVVIVGKVAFTHILKIYLQI